MRTILAVSVLLLAANHTRGSDLPSLDDRYLKSFGERFKEGAKEKLKELKAARTLRKTPGGPQGAVKKQVRDLELKLFHTKGLIKDFSNAIDFRDWHYSDVGKKKRPSIPMTKARPTLSLSQGDKDRLQELSKLGAQLSAELFLYRKDFPDAVTMTWDDDLVGPLSVAHRSLDFRVAGEVWDSKGFERAFIKLFDAGITQATKKTPKERACEVVCETLEHWTPSSGMGKAFPLDSSVNKAGAGDVAVLGMQAWAMAEAANLCDGEKAQRNARRAVEDWHKVYSKLVTNEEFEGNKIAAWTHYFAGRAAGSLERTQSKGLQNFPGVNWKELKNQSDEKLSKVVKLWRQMEDGPGGSGMETASTSAFLIVLPQVRALVLEEIANFKKKTETTEHNGSLEPYTLHPTYLKAVKSDSYWESPVSGSARTVPFRLAEYLSSPRQRADREKLMRALETFGEASPILLANTVRNGTHSTTADAVAPYYFSPALYHAAAAVQMLQTDLDTAIDSIPRERDRVRSISNAVFENVRKAYRGTGQWVRPPLAAEAYYGVSTLDKAGLEMNRSMGTIAAIGFCSENRGFVEALVMQHREGRALPGRLGTSTGFNGRTHDVR